MKSYASFEELYEKTKPKKQPNLVEINQRLQQAKKFAISKVGEIEKIERGDKKWSDYYSSHNPEQWQTRKQFFNLIVGLNLPVTIDNISAEITNIQDIIEVSRLDRFREVILEDVPSWEDFIFPEVRAALSMMEQLSDSKNKDNINIQTTYGDLIPKLEAVNEAILKQEQLELEQEKMNLKEEVSEAKYENKLESEVDQLNENVVEDQSLRGLVANK